MTFDQTERYRGAGLILDTFFRQPERHLRRVLDVGGYFHTLHGEELLPLQKMFPGLDSIVADITPCSLPGYHRLTPGKPLPFDNQEFAVTICMDVLEHVPQDQRESFLEDLLRVTDGIVILGAPFDHPVRRAADRWLAEYCQAIMSEKNPMLEEHLLFGLPDPSILDAGAALPTWPRFSFPNGDLGAWHIIMAVKHLLLVSAGPEAAMAFEAETLQHALAADPNGPGYRDVHVIFTNLSLSQEPFRQAVADAQKLLRNHRHQAAGAAIDAICARHLQRVGMTIREFGKTVEMQRAEYRAGQMEQLRLKRLLRTKAREVDHLGEYRRKLDVSVREKNLVIDQLLERERVKEAVVISHIREYEKGIDAMRRSASYRVGRMVLMPVKAGAALLRRWTGSNCPEQEHENDGECCGKETSVVSPIVPDPRISTLSHRITFSILVPVYNTDADVFRAMIESVMAQTYPFWQLCMVDDASPDDTSRILMKEYAQKEPRRIVYAYSEMNSGIAVATQRAATMATGEFIGLLDHDDILAPDALMEVARQLEIVPDADFIYSDEDKVNQEGTEFGQPHYKPDFDPELLLCNNYLNHFTVIRRTVFEASGGYREGFDGSQDYELFLRVTELARTIVHIPHVLYHWRMIPSSAAMDPASKGGIYRERSIRALQETIARRGMDAVVEPGLSPGSYRVRHRVIPSGRVSIIIPTRDAVELVAQCVRSIETFTEYPDYEIVVVDNGSTHPVTREYLAEQCRVNPRFRCLPYDRRFNFSEINNYAVTQTDSRYVLFLNNDIEVTHTGWLTAMMEHAQNEAIGAVGAKLVYPDGRLQHTGVFLGMGGIAGHPFKGMPDTNGTYFGHSNLIKNYSAVTAACMLMRRDVFDEVGGFNPELAVSFNDIDLCLEIRRRGYRIVYTPYARLIHHESVSRLDDNELPRRPRFHSEITYMISKWGQVLYEDPYLNPNISILNYDMRPRDPSENDTLEAFRRAFSGFIPGM